MKSGYITRQNTVPGHYHHQVMWTAQILLTLYCHPSQLFITLGESFQLPLVSKQSWWMYVFAGVSMCSSPLENVAYQFIFTSSAVSNIFLLGRLVRWEVSGCTDTFFIGWSFPNFFKTAHRILVRLPSSFFTRHFITVHMVQPCSCTDMESTFNVMDIIIRNGHGNPS